MQSFLDDGQVRVIVRLSHVENLNNEDLTVPRANRAGFEFDGVDARASREAILASIRGDGDGRPLTVVRVVTTRDHFALLAKRDELVEGDWFVLTLHPRGKHRGPYAWAAPRGPGGYVESRPFVLDEVTWLFHDDEPPARPLGASVPAERALAQAIAAACSFPATAVGRTSEIRALLHALPPLHDAVVHDVGQAGFVSLRSSSGDEVVHLDAGWPTPWNIKTAPPTPPVLKAAAAPVILSHWDWDHLHGYHSDPVLAAATWIVPVQKLSPTKAPIAATLAKNRRLLAVTARQVSGGSITLGRCTGKKGDFNNSGLAVRARLASGRELLFVGDAHYDLARPSMSGPADLLVVTHHGADVEGAVAAPRGGAGQAVVSVGTGNAYRHPSTVAVRAHRRKGWALDFTSGPAPANRGERILGP